MDNEYYVTCDPFRVMNQRTIQPGPAEGILVALVLLLFIGPTLLCSVSRDKEQCCYKLTLETQTDSSRQSIAVAFMNYTSLTRFGYLRKFIYNFLHVFVISHM